MNEYNIGWESEKKKQKKSLMQGAGILMWGYKILSDDRRLNCF